MMNPVIDMLYARKSVRAYEDTEIAPEIKQAILESAVQAPSAGNMTLYTILDITDQELKDKLAVTCDNQPFIAKAKMVLVFCADYRRWYDVFCKYIDPVRVPAEGDMLLAQQDTLVAAQTTVIAAESFGIGSCYIGDILENYETHQKLLNLPKYVIPTCMVVFGYPTEQQKTRKKPARFRVEDIVHENGYSMEKANRMDAMLMERQKRTGEEFVDWLEKFCARKWNSEFSVEMSRSGKEIIDSWNK